MGWPCDAPAAAPHADHYFDRAVGGDRSGDGLEVDDDYVGKPFSIRDLPATHPGRAFSRDFLLEHLCGYDYDGADWTVDSHVAQVRRKQGGESTRIATVWGVGYRRKSEV